MSYPTPTAHPGRLFFIASANTTGTWLIATSPARPGSVKMLEWYVRMLVSTVLYTCVTRNWPRL